MAQHINRVTITGNLTRDPETRAFGGGGSVTNLRVAVNGRRKDGQTGQWVDDPNFFDVAVFGPQGENCGRFLRKGRPVAVDGRLNWREWNDQNGNKRQSVDIIAETVQFLGGRDDAPSGTGNGFSPNSRAGESDTPANTADFVSTTSTGGGAAEDDIPF